MSRLRSGARRALSSRWIARAFNPLTRGRATLFTLHRFRDPELGILGHDPANLASALERLRRGAYDLISTGELVRRLESAPAKLFKAVCFTVDDGYDDFERLAAPIFGRFDCPVTVFVTTDLADGRWMWWDRLEYVLQTGMRDSRRLPPGHWLHDAFHGPAPDWVVRRRRVFRCFKPLREVAKREAIEQFAAELGVELPERPPARYRPMRWETMRELESRGVDFGPHTVSHPILARADDVQSREEIERSWARLHEELNSPAPVFCYPNGQPEDYTERETRTLRELGLRAAVTASPGYASSDLFREETPLLRYSLPRFNFPEHSDEVMLIASGFRRSWFGGATG